MPSVVQGTISFQKKAKERPFQAFGAAAKVWSCRDDQILVVGPARTGKSRALLEKAHYCAMKYPGARILLVRKTRGSMSESVLQSYEEDVLQDGHPVLNGSKRSIRQEYIYPNKARIIPAGMDNPEKVLSSEYDMIFCFESLELTENDYEVLTTRLSHNAMPYRQIIMDCNPGSPTHWIRQKMLKGHFTVFESYHQDNPRWYNHKVKAWTKMGISYLNRLKRTTGIRYQRLYKGLWVAAEGVIYEVNQKHLLTRGIHFKQSNGEIPKEWRRIRAIDFGFTKPFVCHWYAIDPDGRMYLYREIYMTHRLVRDHARLIVTLSAGENIEATVADWDAEGRADLESNGVPTIQAYKAWESGKEAVQDRLRIAGDGKPRLYFLEDSLVEADPLLEEISHPIKTVQEVDQYIYKRKKGDVSEKEEPIDEYDHGMDTMRYAVCYVDRVGEGMVIMKGESAEVVERPGSLAASINSVNSTPSTDDFCVYV